MTNGARRAILRWVHIVFSIPIIGYVYSPFNKIPDYAPAVRLVFLPILIVSGLRMWHGRLVCRFVSKASAQQ